MHIDNLGFALPILVLAILIALLKLLRHLLRTPSPAPRTSTTGQAGAVHAEPLRLSRRLQPLRGLEHEHREAVLT